MKEEKIIQIMPAPESLYALYEDGNGTKFTAPIVCLALTNNGDVIMMDTDDYGEISEIGGIGITNHEVIPDD